MPMFCKMSYKGEEKGGMKGQRRRGGEVEGTRRRMGKVGRRGKGRKRGGE